MSTHSLLSLHRAVEGSEALLRASIDLDYPNRKGVLRQVAFEIAPGEVLGLIGESGSGKSSVALSILRLLRQRDVRLSGSIQFGGRELLSLREREMRKLRGREISLVLQSPLASLNPMLTTGAQLREAWRAHRYTSREQAESEIARVLELVRLPTAADFLRLYPRQLSVGLAQRVLIAMAILHRPKLLIADEPTSALDAITASEILKLFVQLNRELGMAILFISHDLLSVASLCGRVAIMRAGQIVECARAGDIFRNPRHEYTRALVEAMPKLPRDFTAQEAAENGGFEDRLAALQLLDSGQPL